MTYFQYYAPVALHVGRGCVEENAPIFARHGRRCFVITSRFAPGFHNLALDDACRVLRRQGTEYTVWDDVEENPSVESIRTVTDLMIDFAPDFLLAIGGGSALDTAKAANVLIHHPRQANAYQVFYRGTPAPVGTPSAGKLPLLGIPTTAGSGSEVAGYAVLTRKDIGTKLRMDQLSFFTEAFLDARYIERSPQWLIDAGALDAFAHGIESSLNVASNFTNRMLADFGLMLFRDYKDRLLTEELTAEDYDNMLLAASVQGMAVVQSSTTLPHGMGYVLTHDKDLTHGIASCVCLGEYLKIFREPHNQATVKDIVQKSGFADIDELEDYLAMILRRNISFTVKREEAERWASQFCKNAERFARHPETVAPEMIREIYLRSLDRIGILTA